MQCKTTHCSFADEDTSVADMYPVFGSGIRIREGKKPDPDPYIRYTDPG